MAIGNALMDMYREMREEVCDYDDEITIEEQSYDNVNTTVVCPECGEPLDHEGGCDICKSCGYSHCG